MLVYVYGIIVYLSDANLRVMLCFLCHFCLCPYWEALLRSWKHEKALTQIRMHTRKIASHILSHVDQAMAIMS